MTGDSELTVEAADRWSGVASVELLVDGQRLDPSHLVTPTCTSSGCPTSASATFNLAHAAMSLGDHTVSVVVRDQLAPASATTSSERAAASAEFQPVRRRGRRALRWTEIALHHDEEHVTTRRSFEVSLDNYARTQGSAPGVHRLSFGLRLDAGIQVRRVVIRPESGLLLTRQPPRRCRSRRWSCRRGRAPASRSRCATPSATEACGRAAP